MISLMKVLSFLLRRHHRLLGPTCQLAYDVMLMMKRSLAVAVDEYTF